jgi:hypothetical protein
VTLLRKRLYDSFEKRIALCIYNQNPGRSVERGQISHLSAFSKGGLWLNARKALNKRRNG